MKLLQRARKCSPHARREDKPQRLFEPTSAGKSFPASRPKRLAALALLGFAICLPASAVATATESLHGLCYRLEQSQDFAERLHAAEAIAEYGQLPCLRFASCCGTRFQGPRIRCSRARPDRAGGRASGSAIDRHSASAPGTDLRHCRARAGTHWAGSNSSRTGYTARRPRP